MARAPISNLVRVTGRGLQTTPGRISRIRLATIAASPSLTQFTPRPLASIATPRFVSNSVDRQNVLTPDNKTPEPKIDMPDVIKTPADLTDNEYHDLADEFMERALHHFEDLQDARSDFDVEFSAGVLKVNLGSEVGEYVINKQPPNKQIWLSSPKTGPKRFDYVMLGDGQQDKQDTASGDWIYLRDGTRLTDILLEEVGVDVTAPIEEHF